MRILLSTAAVAAALLAAVPAVAQQRPAGPVLPAGDGHDLVAQACTQCHAPTLFMQLREDQHAWKEQVYDMILRGAQVAPGDVDTVVTYLATNFGPGVDVPPPATKVTLADGAGKDVVANNCSVCHGLDRIADTKRTPEQWTAILARMHFYGAPFSADDGKTIAAYLDATYGAK